VKDHSTRAMNDETPFGMLCETSIRRRKLPALWICIFEICRMHMQQIKCTLVSAMHVILLLPRVFRTFATRPVKLHGHGRKTIPFACIYFANINFALFVMNIQRMISSSNQLLNFLTYRTSRSYRHVSKQMLAVS